MELGDALLVAEVVGIDVDQPVECLAAFLHAAGGEVQIEEPHEHVEVLRFAIHLLVDPRGGFGQRQRRRMGGRQAVDLGHEFGIFPGGAQPFGEMREQRGGFGVLGGADIGSGNLEELRKGARFFFVMGFEDVPRLVQTPGLHQGLSEQRQECRVLLGGGQRLQGVHGSLGIALADLGLGQKQGAGAVCREKPMGPSEVVQSLIGCSRCLQELSGP